MMLPGIKVNTGPDDFFPIEQMQLMKFDGEAWRLFGDVITGEVGHYPERWKPSCRLTASLALGYQLPSMGLLPLSTQHQPSEKTSAGDASRGECCACFSACFFCFSGMSSLLYQTAWQRLLGLFYGVGAVSSAIVIGAFFVRARCTAAFLRRAVWRSRTNLPNACHLYRDRTSGIGLFATIEYCFDWMAGVR